MFGGANGAKIYGVIFSAFAVASISGTFLNKVTMHGGCLGVWRVDGGGEVLGLNGLLVIFIGII